MTENEIETIITDEQTNILNKMEYLPEGTALNVALKENVFMLLICILSKIPIFLVGKPGCSKSLSIQLIRSNLRGKDSANDLFKDMPQLFCVSFQGSESSTSEGIIKVFEKAQKYQEYNDEKDVLSLVILDEIGLAEESRFNPLKVLHEILEPGQGKQLNIAVVGISNWALDAAKMNRAIHLSRPDMSLRDLQLTGQSICKSMMATTEKDKELVMSVKSSNDNDYSNNIVQRLLDVHWTQMENILSAGEKKMAEEILIGILRNFGGLPTEKENILEIFRNYIPCITSTPVPVIRLIRENILDKTSRHLMLIASGNAVISVLERELNEMKLPFDIIFGSNFKEDLNDDYNYRILSRIILCMEKGMVLILKDLDAIYGSLYDMLNQNYTVVGKKKNCRVALGHYSNPMCHVHDDFKCIVLVEEYNLDYSDPPFLNRFEKQHFQFTDLLRTEKMKSMVEEISQEMKSLCQIPNHSFIPEDVIPSYSLDLIVSLIIHLNQKVDDEHIKDCAFERMLWLIPPEVMIRAKESKFSQSKQYFVTEKIRNFMKLPIHGGICHFSQNFKHSALESTRTDGSSDQFVECFVVYTYSSLHSIIEDWFGDDQVQKQKIASFKSEKEFTTTVEHFFESKRSVFILQCTAGSETQHMLLSKTIIEKVVRKYQQTRESNQSRKYVYAIFHLDRGCYVHLPVNFLSSWNLLYMDSIQKPRTPLDHFLKVDKLEIVRERMPLHNYITDALFWVLSRIKFASGDDITGSLLEFLLSSLNSCQYAIDTIEEMIVSWIERRTQSESSSTWCINVAKSPHDLILSGNLIGALENNIQDFIKTPLSKYIFKMIDLNILTPVIFEDEFTTCRRKSWRKCVLSTEHLNIKDIPEPSGPECYSCSSRFLNLRMPFSQVFSQTIENNKDEFLYIVRRRCIEKNIEVDEEIPRELFENEVNDSIEIICYDALTIDHYPSQNDDYIYDFSNLFSSQFLSTDEPNRIQIFKWALSNFINLSLYLSRKFENLVAALHATVWVYGTVVKAICIMALEPAASLDLTYHIPLPADTIVTGFQNKYNTENDSHSIRIADLDRQSFVEIICSSLLPTSTVLKHYEISKWLLKVGQILQLAQSVHYESSGLRCLKLCHEISEALFENKIPVENDIYQIADSLKNANVTIDSEEVCNIIFETLKKLHETNVDGKVLQNLFCSYIVRCLNTNSENLYPFQFSLEKIASNEVFDETLNYYGQILKYAVALDANENPNIFFEMLSGEEVLNENMQFCKCLDVCLKKIDYKLDKNMYLPVLATDILEYVAFGEDLSIDEMNKVNSASSKLYTYLTQAMNLADKGICSIYTLVSVAYIRKFLKNAFAILKTCKYDCTDKGVLASQVNAILCQRKDTGFVTLLSSEMLHLFLKIVEHVSGQENVEKILRKLDNTIIVLQNIHWNTEVVEEMPVFNPLILHVEMNALGEYQRHVKDILTDDTPLSELLDDTSSGSPITILCLLTKQFYMKKCFHQLTDDEKRTAKAIVGIVKKSVLKRKVKDIIEHVLGPKDFKHGIFNLSEATESPVPQIVSVMIHLATIIVMNNQENTAWHKQLFCPLSVKFELSTDLPPIIRDVLKLIWYSCLTCSYAFEFADTKSLKELTSESTENLEEYLRKSLENSWTCLHDILEINYFDICLLLHEFLFKSKDLFAGKAEEYMNNFSEQLIHEHAVILEDVMGNRMQIIHEAKTRFARKIGSDLEQCVLDDKHCTSNVEFPKVALLLRLSRSSSKNMLLTEIHAGHKSRFRFLTTVVRNMPELVLPKHLSSLIKWHHSVVTFGTYKFRKLDFKDMTVSSFLCAFNEDSQRNVLEKAFNEFAKSWNEIRLALSNLKEVLNGQTESGKIELSLMHKNATMKECSIIDEDSIFVEVLKYLANIQNQFLKDSGDKVTNVDSMLIHPISIQDVKCEHLISFKLDDDWIDYCQCETRYGLGQKMNFYLDMIEKDMEQVILTGKVFIEIPNPVMKIIFIDELFQNSIELLKEISRNHVQNILPEKIKTAIRLQTSRDISTVSQLLTHTGMTLSLLRKKGPGSGPVDISIRDYLHNLKHITGMSSSVIHSLFPGDIKISHAVNLYQWLEELNGDSIIETLEDEYRIELQDNAIQCLHMAKQYMDHLEKLDHPLKVFAHRCLSVTSNKIRNSQPLNEYLANKDLWWQDDLKYDEDKKNGRISVVADGVYKSLEELLSPLIMVENIYYTVQFLAEAIKEAKQKEQPFFNMEQPKVEKQYPKKEHGKQVIKKMKKRL
ncbi:RNF213 [Mytilus coruscus]|uniref:RNF213 n=1 Tax=Mytilus coruscus TaxID=42192 RepID=A0A6J8D4G2_MYTCO|nr:RNF213 [Mytilus coruscus]